MQKNIFIYLSIYLPHKSSLSNEYFILRVRLTVIIFMNHTFSFVIQHPLFNLHTS